MSARDLLLEKFGGLLLDEPPLLKTPHTIQVLILRQTQDYTIFRTEETRELNTASLPRSMRDPEPVVRVAMLAAKQKAAESRRYVALAKALAHDHGVTLTDAQQNCYLKDHLCRACPRCVLFGAVSTEGKGGATDRWNIKHRIEYSTAFSIRPYTEAMARLTFNAVDSATQSTKQALGETENVLPMVTLPSVVSLSAATVDELLLYLKTVLSCHSYGAETRHRGDMTNHVVGLVGGYEEVITSLEFTLELADRVEPGTDRLPDAYGAVAEVVAGYARHAALADKVTYLVGDEMQQFLEALSATPVGAEEIGRLYTQAGAFRQRAEAAAKEK